MTLKMKDNSIINNQLKELQIQKLLKNNTN